MWVSTIAAGFVPRPNNDSAAAVTISALPDQAASTSTHLAADPSR
jgi:hypothetical protein